MNEEFDDSELIKLSNDRKILKLLSKVQYMERTSMMNPNTFRYGLVLKDGINGDRVYLTGDNRRKEFNFSYRKYDSELNIICNMLNEMPFDTVKPYINTWGSRSFND